MRISLNWFSEYVTLPAPEDAPQGVPGAERGLAAIAELVARRLTAVGLEVEGIERTGTGLGGVVAARIVTSEKHPNAEKLSVTRVDAGSGEPLQIVCGAKNYEVGDVVPLATVGAVLPGGTRIEKAKLRGVESSGMLCSAKELGLAEEASGLLLLDRGVAPGTPIAKALALEDVLLEVNVTPNRPDALSHLGVAREVAAALGTTLRAPAPRLSEKGAPASDAVKVRIEAPDRCARYAARVVEGVKIGPSPTWLARRLESCGVRSISNVVDATNFVLLELGHPLHAFDLDKVAGREIVVRTARPGEKMVTLDGGPPHRRSRPRQRARWRHGRRRLRDLLGHDAGAPRVGLVPARLHPPHLAAPRSQDGGVVPLRARRRPGHGDPRARSLRGAHRRARGRHRPPRHRGRAPARGARAGGPAALAPAGGGARDGRPAGRGAPHPRRPRLRGARRRRRRRDLPRSVLARRRLHRGGPRRGDRP